MITIIDYSINNLWSVQTALESLNIKYLVTNKEKDILNSSHIILPGVGSFKTAMESIKELKIDENIRAAASNNTKILGICLGMQLLGLKGYEDGETKGIGLIDSEIKKFKLDGINKIPHIGFNTVYSKNSGLLFKNLDKFNDFYFVHSYVMSITSVNQDIIIHNCQNGENFIAAFEYNNICGTQFHPEKSQTNGLKLLYNFYNS